MSGSDCGLSLGAQASALPPERPARTGLLDEAETSEENDCHTFHELLKKLSTRKKWPCRQLSAPTLTPPDTISARHKTGLSTRTQQANGMRQQFSFGAILFMSSLIVQMFSINSALHSNSWPRREPARNDRFRQANLLTWSSSSSSATESDSAIRSELIPSARYVYTYPNHQARKRVRAPAAATTTSARNGDRIRHLHDQLNQLKRELDQELAGGDSLGVEVADSHEMSTTPEGVTRRPVQAAVSQIELGSPCLSTNFCQKSIRNSHCNLERFTCECLSEHVKLNSTTCLAPALLGFECQLDDQCRRRVADSVCRAGKCTCQDENLLAYKRNKCLRASKLNDYCLLDGQCQLNDRHSFCRWKIQNVYGTCKCPPNYKLASDQGNELRCAPRLGDSCLNDLECRLATANSICGQVELFSNKRKWTSSLASNRSCTCETGFRWSENMLECLPVPNEVNSTSANSLSLQQMSVKGDTKKQDDSHRYELLDAVPPQVSTAPSDSQTQADARNKIPAGQVELEIVELPTSPKQTTTTASTTTTTERPALNENQTQLDTNTTFRMVSLGKACRWRQECQARDPNSDCIDGVCECLAPSSRCRASARGCHPNTFQCRSGQCISWYFVCDQFRNCDDGSDEDDCRPGHCPGEAFQCRADGQCLTRGRVCDGQRDCSDGSDEFGCGSDRGSGGNQTKSGNNNNNNNSSSGCPAEAFACANGQCLPGYVFCNAVQDCADRSDEDELICERTSASTVAANRHRLPSPPTTTTTATLGQTQARAPPARRNETIEAESPLVKTDRASIERLMAALGLTNAAKWRQKSPTAASQTSRRSRLMKNRLPLEERRGTSAQASARRQHLVKNQRHGLTTETSSLECPASGFTCRNGKCRSSAILCSGIDGCGDNSDEDHCEVCQCEPPSPQPPPASRSTNSRRHNVWLT